jgi:hypothetical protein
VAFTFREHFLDGLKQREAHLRLAAAAAEQADFFVIRAPRSRFTAYEIADAIEATIMEAL